MIRFETEQTIDRSAADVWAYASDIVRHPEWMGVADARVVQGEGTEVGARGKERFKLGPRAVEVELVVSASEPGRRIAWTVIGGGPMAGDVTLDLDALGPNTTRVIWSGWIGMKGAWRLLEPVLASEVRAGEAAELQRLKANLEATPRQDP